MFFKLSPEDIRCESLLAHRDHYRNFVIGALEERLQWLNENSFHSRHWLPEERKRVQTEIAEAQKIIGDIEAQVKAMGKDADVLEGIHMDANYE